MDNPRNAWRVATWIAAALLAATVCSDAAGGSIAYLVWTRGPGGAQRAIVNVMNLETGDTRVLVELDRASGLDASPDGRRFVCTTGKGADSRLTLIDARTGAVDHLPRDHALGVYNVPKFSPAGDALLYNYAQPAGAAFAVKLLDLRAGSSVWLTKRGFRAWGPAWSPDGTQIVLVKKDPRKLYHDLHIMPAGGGEPRNLTFWLEHDDEPAWSPDGTEIAFIRSHKDKGQRLVVYEMTTGAVRDLTEPTFEALHPSWSPDGQHIVFAGATVEDVDRGRDTVNVYSIRRDGTDMRRLTHHEPNWAVYPLWVDADLLPVSRRGKAGATWGALKQEANGE